MTNELHFPDVIDNSMRKELVKCQKIAHWKFERGLNAEIGNEHLVAGGAFAKGMEVMRKMYYQDGEKQAAALQEGIVAVYKQYGQFVPPSGSLKTAERMAGALAYYAENKPFDGEELVPLQLGDGMLGIEVAFNHELPILHPKTNKRLSYCGRFDMLAEDKQGKVWVVDEKTTGRMGDAWAHQWDLDSQMSGYVWGAQKLLKKEGIDKEVVGAVINGISILKYGYDTMRCPTFRQDWEVLRWYEQMLDDVDGWISAFKHQDHDQILDHGCALYNAPCQYAKLCKARDPEKIVGSYAIKFWNPMLRD